MSRSDLFLGIDVGTSATKVVLVTDAGRLIASSTAAYPLHHPAPGWAEQSAEYWWDGTIRAVRSVLKRSGVKASRVAAIGLSGQMHGSVFLDESMRVIRPPILWCDVRTSEQCRLITDRVGGRERLAELTANRAFEGFTLPKILWLREHEPEAYAKTRWIVLPKDYVRFRLTGQLLTEISDAAGTLLVDVANRRWSQPVFELLDLPSNLVPPLVNAYDLAGDVTKEAAELMGLIAGTPVVAGGADNACGAIGAGAVAPGETIASIGSSGVVLTVTDHPAYDKLGRIHTFNYAAEERWYLMGSTLAAGLALRWFKEALALPEQAVEASGGPAAYSLLDAEAASSVPLCHGLFFLPYLNGERSPHADADARGVWFGLSATHTRADLVRSVLEGVVFSLRDTVEIIRQMGYPLKRIRATGGGSRSSLWCQLQADIFGASILLPEVNEGPALGAAILAMVGAGRYRTVADAVEHTIRISRVYTPSEWQEHYDEGYRFYNSLYPALQDRFKRLAELRGGTVNGNPVVERAIR